MIVIFRAVLLLCRGGASREPLARTQCLLSRLLGRRVSMVLTHQLDPEIPPGAVWKGSIW